MDDCGVFIEPRSENRLGLPASTPRKMDDCGVFIEPRSENRLGLPASTPPCYHRRRYENEKRQECNRLVLAREQKQSVVDTYRTHPTDTGSPEVQIALLSERIGQLTEHFKTHQKDHGSRRGLLMMVSRRRSLLDYLKKYDSERYKTVISKLGIRK